MDRLEKEVQGIKGDMDNLSAKIAVRFSNENVTK
jgi:hypothetical protein